MMNFNDLGGEITLHVKASQDLLTAFKELEDKHLMNLFTPGNCFTLTDGDNMVQYVALDPQQKPPKNGLFQAWISVEDDLPPPDQCKEYLVRVRSGGPLYGGWEYNTDIAWWSEFWGIDGSHGYDWNSIMTDWDGDVQITHWMPIPEPPEV